MTLIVWDGGRRKRRRLAVGVVQNAAPMVRADQVRPLPTASTGEPVASAEGRPIVHVPHDTEGSRIGMATRVSGRLTANEPVTVKGCIEGAVIARDHHVMVTMSGRVSSYLEGREVSVDGEVAGRLKAGDKITLRSRARVWGIMEAERLECHAGAHIQGEVAPMTAG
ncbi:bactofilin family protein [Billgrantia sp. C5P2]|uniref:bactofilin family protein n=1 Tax=Billgrantia sp. C5P2 TaxID=3436239 RepID=UPI003EA90D8F